MSEEQKEDNLEQPQEKPEAQGQTEQARKKASLFRNYISFVGATIAFASFISITFLIIVDITGTTDNPYMGIFTYIIFPAILISSFTIILFGMLLERRRRRKFGTSQIAAYPVLDLNDPRRRRSAFVFLGLSLLFIFMSAFGSYRAYEYTDTVTFCGQLCHSVMKPEFTAYKVSPHARVRCVDCHVGEGAEWYVRSKISGAYQLYSVAFNKYSRPITTPVHSLRPEKETCAQCHWPEKFHGEQLRVFDRYGYDEKNTLHRTRMLVKTGGGNPQDGPISGIHWHVNYENEVSYIHTDEQRQIIPWIRVKDKTGKVTEYVSSDSKLTPEQIASSAKRVMDCADCHNRPTHVYLPPDTSVNVSLSNGKIDTSLPFIKRQAVEVLSKPYQTNDEALKSIESQINDFYQKNHAEIYANKSATIKAAIAELKEIYQTYAFPEMRTDWQTHPNNIGHYYFQGCFRCHDGQHKSPTGEIIRSDCNSCHTILDQTTGSVTTAAKEGAFNHPVGLGDTAKFNCTVCHRGDKTFQHPRDLGDIAKFRCVDCHSGKDWNKGNP